MNFANVWEALVIAGKCGVGILGVAVLLIAVVSLLNRVCGYR